MSGTHVRIRLEANGMVASDHLRASPGARLACIEVGRRTTPLGLVVDHFGLAEGLSDQAIADMVATWEARYGVPAASVGAPFALRLPLPLDRVTTPGVAELHGLDLAGATPIGHVLQGGLCDLWVECRDAMAAETLAVRLRGLLPRGVTASVAVGDPTVADRECWAALRLAADVGLVA